MAATYASSPPYYPTGVPPEGGTISRRVDRPDYRVDPETGCWVWQGATQPDGSPRCQPTKPTKSKRRIARGETRPVLIVYSRAHREYYRRAHGEIPDGFDLVRTCPNRSCVNPAHLEAVRHDQRLAAWHQENRSPLSQADVDEIRAGVKTGVKQRVYELRFGVCNMTISNIVTNRTWFDPSYEPGVEKQCALPECRRTVVTTRSTGAYCTAKHKDRHRNRLDRGRYEQEAERKAERRAGNATRLAVERAWSLDAPVSSDSTTSLGELVAGNGAHDVTFAAVEAQVVRDVLRGLTVEDAETLTDDARAAYRLALARAGVSPPSVRHHVGVLPCELRRMGTPTPGPSRRTMPRSEQRIVASIERTARERHEAWREPGHPNVIARLTGDLEALFDERREAQAGTFDYRYAGETTRLSLARA